MHKDFNNFLNEGRSDYKYRFKTEKEFIYEFGDDWKHAVGFNTGDQMDHLIGTPINVPSYCIGYDGDIIRSFNMHDTNYSDPRGNWSVGIDMVKKEKAVPTYKPKKFIYESNTKKYKYRFKTEEELLDEFGDNWHEEVDWNDEGYMDYLLGTDIDEKYIEEDDYGIREFYIPNTNTRVSYSKWIITGNLIKKEKVLPPQYKPKKLVYESNTNKYTYRFKTKEEFEEESKKTGGRFAQADWRHYAHFNDRGDMDYLLGTDVNVPERCIDHRGEVVGEFEIYNTDTSTGNSTTHTWYISPVMLKRKKTAHDLYQPKKFVYENNEPIKTKKGTIIKRYKDVGKKMGNDLYIHKDYAEEYIDKYFYNRLKRQLPKGFKYTVVKYNKKNETISFIYSPDFDTADEPIVSDAYKVTKDGKITHTREKSTPQIYHHKWLFVKDDYKGFNVGKSRDRSRRWLDVSGEINMSKIGSKGYWEEEVLPLLESSVWSTKKQEYSSAKTSINQVPKPARKLIENDELEEGSINLDIGGGKYNTLTNFFLEHNITNYVYDPYNRSKEHNMEVVKITKNGQSDSVTIFNVLNVIPEKENQINVLRKAKNAVKKGGKIYIYSNYYVKGKEPGPVKGRDSFQQNYKLPDILPIIQEVFPKAELNRELMCVVATK